MGLKNVRGPGWAVFIAKQIALSFPELSNNARTKLADTIVEQCDNFVATGGLEKGGATAKNAKGLTDQVLDTVSELSAEDYEAAFRIIAVT